MEEYILTPTPEGKKMRTIYFILFSILILVMGCMDQCTPRRNIQGPYYLEKNETGAWELNYDLGDGSGIGRVNSVNEIGWTDRFIFTKYDTLYFFIDKSRDNMYYNANDIVTGPIGSETYLKFLDSLNLNGFKLHKP